MRERTSGARRKLGKLVAKEGKDERRKERKREKLGVGKEESEEGEEVGRKETEKKGYPKTEGMDIID